MKNLTLFEKVVTLASLLALLLLIAIPTTIKASTEIIAICTVLAIFTGIWLIVLVHYVNDERDRTITVKEYNELRSALIMTKLHTFELTSEKEGIKMVLCSRHRSDCVSMNCNECVHSEPHIHQPSCDIGQGYDCQTILIISK
jgi:hypothetical protein